MTGSGNVKNFLLQNSSERKKRSERKITSRSGWEITQHIIIVMREAHEISFIEENRTNELNV
jgi:hypothetical protein